MTPVSRGEKSKGRKSKTREKWKGRRGAGQEKTMPRPPPASLLYQSAFKSTFHYLSRTGDPPLKKIVLVLPRLVVIKLLLSELKCCVKQNACFSIISNKNLIENQCPVLF